MKKYIFLIVTLFLLIFSSCKEEPIISVKESINLTYGETLNLDVNIENVEIEEKVDVLNDITYKYDNSYFDENMKAISVGDTIIYTIYKEKQYETKVHIEDTLLDYKIEPVGLNEKLVITPINIGSRNLEDIKNNMEVICDEYYFTSDLRSLQFGTTNIKITYKKETVEKQVTIIDQYASDREFLNDFSFSIFTGSDSIILEIYYGSQKGIIIPSTLLGLKVKCYEWLKRDENLIVSEEIEEYEYTETCDYALQTEVQNQYSTQKYSEGILLHKEYQADSLESMSPGTGGTIGGYTSIYRYESLSWIEDGKVIDYKSLSNLYAPGEYLGYKIDILYLDSFNKDAFNCQLHISVGENIKKCWIMESYAIFDFPSSLREFFAISSDEFLSSSCYDYIFHNKEFDFIGLRNIKWNSYSVLEKVLSKKKSFTSYTDENGTKSIYMGSEFNPYLMFLSSEVHDKSVPIILHKDCICIPECYMYRNLTFKLNSSIEWIWWDLVNLTEDSLSIEILKNIKRLGSRSSAYRKDPPDYFLEDNRLIYIKTIENPHYILLIIPESLYYTIPSLKKFTINENTKKIFILSDIEAELLASAHIPENVEDIYFRDVSQDLFDKIKNMCNAKCHIISMIGTY